MKQSQLLAILAHSLREFGQWVVLMHQKQVTIGSLVIVAKSDATNLGALKKAV